MTALSRVHRELRGCRHVAQDGWDHGHLPLAQVDREGVPVEDVGVREDHAVVDHERQALHRHVVDDARAPAVTLGVQAKVRLRHGGVVVRDARRDDAHVGFRPQPLPPHRLAYAHRVNVAAAHLGTRARVLEDTHEPLLLLRFRVNAVLAQIVLRSRKGGDAPCE